MQNVEDFMDDLPADEQVIVKRLRNLILSAEPRVREKISYGVPYFSRHRRLFFIWPESAQPGLKKNSSRGFPKVTLGFCYGNLLSDHHADLVRDSRKQVFTIGISKASDMDDRHLAEIIQEAVMVDEQFFGNSTSLK